MKVPSEATGSGAPSALAESGMDEALRSADRRVLEVTDSVMQDPANPIVAAAFTVATESRAVAYNAAKKTMDDNHEAASRVIGNMKA
jgi:hypothetical protein